jgi:hypothetical protein
MFYIDSRPCKKGNLEKVAPNWLLRYSIKPSHEGTTQDPSTTGKQDLPVRPFVPTVMRIEKQLEVLLS